MTDEEKIVQFPNAQGQVQEQGQSSVEAVRSKSDQPPADPPPIDPLDSPPLDAPPAPAIDLGQVLSRPGTTPMPSVLGAIAFWVGLTDEQRAEVPPDLRPDILEFQLWPGVSVFMSQTMWRKLTNERWDLNLNIVIPTKEQPQRSQLVLHNRQAPPVPVPDTSRLIVELKRTPKSGTIVAASDV